MRVEEVAELLGQGPRGEADAHGQRVPRGKMCPEGLWFFSGMLKRIVPCPVDFYQNCPVDCSTAISNGTSFLRVLSGV